MTKGNINNISNKMINNNNNDNGNNMKVYKA